MPQPERRLALVDAGAEQLELELRLQLAERGVRRTAHAEARLAHAGKRAAVLAELVLEGRQPGQPHRVGPVRVDLIEVVADVQHREAVDLERRLRVGLRRRILSLQLRVHARRLSGRQIEGGLDRLEPGQLEADRVVPHRQARDGVGPGVGGHPRVGHVGRRVGGRDRGARQGRSLRIRNDAGERGQADLRQRWRTRDGTGTRGPRQQRNCGKHHAARCPFGVSAHD